LPPATTGADNCGALVSANGSQYGTYDTTTDTADPPWLHGYLRLCGGQDYGSFGKATSYNHSFFVQDACDTREKALRSMPAYESKRIFAG
jgi:hypothetical protein